jgi:hypothetical protein
MSVGCASIPHMNEVFIGSEAIACGRFTEHELRRTVAA